MHTSEELIDYTKIKSLTRKQMLAHVATIKKVDVIASALLIEIFNS